MAFRGEVWPRRGGGTNALVDVATDDVLETLGQEAALHY